MCGGVFSYSFKETFATYPVKIGLKSDVPRIFMVLAKRVFIASVVGCGEIRIRNLV